MPEYSIDIQETWEYTYHVSAANEEEARELATDQHNNGEKAYLVYDNIISMPTITNSEEIG